MSLAIRSLHFSPASLLYLKLAAFLVMLVGHADWFLFDAQFYVHHTLGRIVFPVFGFILAYHVARMETGRVGPLLFRLAFAAAVSAPFYGYLQGAPLPLNILATYFVAIVCYVLWTHRMAPVAVLVFLVASMFVDYSWFGVSGVLVCLWWFRTERRFSLVPLAVFAALLTPINGNLWALLAVPLVAAAAYFLQGDAPRWKWAFYVGYPAHLVVLSGILAFR